jgi:hypothetical protein
MAMEYLALSKQKLSNKKDTEMSKGTTYNMRELKIFHKADGDS